MIRNLCAFFVGIGLLAAAVPARAAAPNSQEEDLIHRGVELRKARDDLSARAEFQKAYDLTHSPRAAAQLGLAEFALGRWDDAETHVSEGLRAPRDPWIDKYKIELDQSLATIKTHVARVEVMGEPIGAEVYVNGRVAGRLPLPGPVAVSEGQVDVELRASGHARGTRTVTLTGGQYQRLVIRLEREPSTAQAANGGSVAAADGASRVEDGAAGPTITKAGSDPHGATPNDRENETSPSAGRRIIKWTSLGLAGAALATGIGATAIYAKNTSTFEGLRGGNCRDKNGQAVDISGAPAPECQSSLDAYLSARTWQIVGFASAGVFATTWLVLTLTEGSSTGTTDAKTSDVATWTCAPTLAAAGAICARRF